MPTLFSASICPYAQRTRALLTHLDEPFTLREIDLRDKPDDFLEVSATGKVPLYVDGDLRLYESQVINDYLAEVHGWDAGYPTDPGKRARHRLAMKQFDDVLSPLFYAGLKEPESFDERAQDASRELDELADTVTDAPLPSLLAFHLATHWARWDWLREMVPAAELVDARPALKRWLDDAVALPAVQATLPARQEVVEQYGAFARRLRQAAK